jgi:replication factor A1
MEGNYSQLIEFISESSGVSIEDIERKVEAKQAKLAGLISKEGAAQVIAAELNVNFDKQMIKIAHIVPGMRRINIVGKIIELSPIREYNKNGRSGRIGSFILADETSNIRTVLWDENHIDLIGKGQVKEEVMVEIGNASIRNGELHLGSFSEIKVSDKKMDNVIIEKPIFIKKINEFNIGDTVSTRAYIVNMFEPKFFEVCPECRKKVVGGECGEHGKVKPERRSLLSLVVDDGSDNIRCTIFHDELIKIISMMDLENLEKFAALRKEFLGKEAIVMGQVRKNQMFDNEDFIISEIKDVDLDNLIEELEK